MSVYSWGNFRAKVGTMFISKIFRIESSSSTAHVYAVTTFWDQFNAILVPCWDHAYISFTSRSSRALQFSKLCPYGLRHKCMKSPLSETLIGPCKDQVKTMFGLSLPPETMEH